MAQDYDVVVIGAGPGGYVCAIRCAQLGLKTAIVERQWWGGVCLNVGCIPSKALLRNAEIAHILNNRGKDFGFSFENLQLDFGVAFKRSRQVSDRLVKGVGFLMKKNKIDTYEGSATIKDKSTVEVALNEGGSETLNCKNLVVATGASPNMIPGIEADGERVVTYEEAIMRDAVPKQAGVEGRHQRRPTVQKCAGKAGVVGRVILPGGRRQMEMEVPLAIQQRGRGLKHAGRAGG